jgi:hypothetical protein
MATRVIVARCVSIAAANRSGVPRCVMSSCNHHSAAARRRYIDQKISA